MQIRTAFLAAIATLPLLAGAATAHEGWGYGGGGGYGRPAFDPDWREREARHAWREAERAREWAWRRQWEQPRYAPPRPYWQGGYGPRW